MKMHPSILIVGILLVFWASAFIIVGIPVATMKMTPSDIWRPLTPEEEEGHKLYIANGCSYCHTLYIRTNDWYGHRIAQEGDFVGKGPIILGTERTGPDLSQNGGEHPDDWHIAHFKNPRHTMPLSVMPNWEFLGEDNIRKLTKYIQSQGFKEADYRMERQRFWKKAATEAYDAGPDRNIQWLHDQVPKVWREMPNPYPPSETSIRRGEKLYQDFCAGCHGTVGDGNGPAAANLYPPPLNFTTLRRHLVDGKYIGGVFYYQIMNGITGTAMPYFKRMLESEKIWDLSNYIAHSFVGYTDTHVATEGVDASYELPYTKKPR